MDEQQIPVRAAKLIIGFLNSQLSKEEHQELNDWMALCDKNILMFEELIDGLEDQAFVPETFIQETEKPLETWIIAGLVTREIFDELSEVQQEALDEWLNNSEDNERLFELMHDHAYLKKISEWEPLDEFLDESKN